MKSFTGRISKFLLTHISATFIGLMSLTSWVQADTAKQLRIAVVANGAAGNFTYASAPQEIAKDKIFSEALAKRGVTLEWVPVTTAAVAALVNESFASGKIDFAFYGDLPSVLLNSMGVRTKLVVSGNVGNNSYLVVPANSTAKTIHDLKGKRIALHRGRPWEVTFSRFVESENLNFRDFKIVNLNPQAGASSIVSGNVDAFFTQSDALILEQKGVGRVIWSTKEAPVAWRMRAELWGNADYIAENPEITQLIADAAVRAMHWISHEENKLAYLSEQGRLGLPVELQLEDITDKNISWKNYWNPILLDSTIDHYQAVIDHAVKQRLIRSPLDVNELVTREYVEKAIKNLKVEGYWSGDAQVTQ